VDVKQKPPEQLQEHLCKKSCFRRDQNNTQTYGLNLWHWPRQNKRDMQKVWQEMMGIAESAGKGQVQGHSAVDCKGRRTTGF
jgi:hypothetical protein